MKTLIALSGKGPAGVTKYTMTQVEDDAYADNSFREHLERKVQDVLAKEYGGFPERLLWIEQEGFDPPDPDFLAALADGAGIPWTILKDRRLDGG